MGLEARGRGIPPSPWRCAAGFPIRGDWPGCVRIVRAWRPDVLHSHMVHANLMARALRLLVPIPAWSPPSTTSMRAAGCWMAAYRLTNGLVDHMTIVSQAAADRFMSASGSSPGSCSGGAPTGSTPTCSGTCLPDARESFATSLGLEREFVWLAVGRFEVAKDYPNMLRAFARVQERQPEAVLLLVGRGSLQEETEALVRELGSG